MGESRGLARILAKTQLKKAYQEAVEDASGRLHAAGVDKEAAAALVGADGQVVGTASGAQAGEQILGMPPS